MCICIFRKHVYIRIGMHTCITYIHAHVHTHIHTYIHTRIHRHIHTQYYIHCMHYIDTYIAYITDITSMHTFHTSHYIHCTHTLYKLHYITLPTFQTNIVRITYIFDQCPDRHQSANPKMRVTAIARTNGISGLSKSFRVRTKC